MKPNRLEFLMILLAAFVLAFAATASALDPPHDASKNVTCVNCHNATLPEWTGVGLDNSPYNAMCKTCHRSGGSAIAQETHSSATTSDVYGTWTYECRVCHNPHWQRQTRVYRSESFLATGKIASVIGNTVTVSPDPGWTDSQWAGYTLQPNIKYPIYYRIANNTSNTITVYGNIKTTFAKSGNTFSITYGKMIKEVINTNKPIVNSDGVVFDSNTWRYVKYFYNSGPNSAAPEGENLNPDTKSICIICHTKTKFNNIGYARYGSQFQTLNMSVYNGHTDSSSGTCWRGGCHKNSQEGFKVVARCSDCHGNPLRTSSDLVKKIKEDGVMKSVSTGSTNAGAHETHFNKYSSSSSAYTCRTCHYGGMDPELQSMDGPNIGDYNTTIEFRIVTSQHTYTGGVYNGHSTLTDGFTYNGAAALAGTRDDTLACSNVYCHGGTLGASAGTKTVVRWVADLGSVTCGTCHKATASAPPELGSHLKHTGANASSAINNLSCSVCHPSDDTYHVDGLTQWQLDTSDTRLGSSAVYKGASSGEVAPVANTAAYGSCSALYCHSNADPYGKSNVYHSVTWGGSSLDCGGCHDKPGATSAWSSPHDKHTDGTGGAYSFACGVCHSTVASATGVSIANKSLHIDGTKQIVINSTYGGEFVQSSHECSNVYCHSTGNRMDKGIVYKTQAWSGSVDCTSCHKSADTRSNMLSGVANMSGAHVAHVATDAGDSYGDPARGAKAIKCNNCHYATTTDGTTIADTSVHVDGVKNVVFDTTWTGGSPSWDSPYCSNVYCHSNGNDFVGSTVPKWNDATTGACGACHGVTASNLPNSPAHAKHAGDSYPYKFECYKCHKDTVTATADSTVQPAVANKVVHVDGNKDVVFNTADPRIGNDSPQISGGTCSNIYCHSDGNPAGVQYAEVTWSNTGLGCNGCHGTGTTNGRPDHSNAGAGLEGANSHSSHSTNSCSECHYSTTSDGTSIRDLGGYTTHVNTTTDIAFDPSGNSNSATYDSTVGQKVCSSTYCHGTASPKWGTVGAITCSDCHQSQGAGDSGTYTGVHQKHTDTAGYRLACENCHAQDNTTNPNMEHAGGEFSEPQSAEVRYSETSGSTKTYGGGSTQYRYVNLFSNPFGNGTLSPTYTKGTQQGTDSQNANLTWTDGTCSSVWCHSNAKPLGGSNTYVSQQWTGTLDCGGCHSKAGDASPTWSSAHTKHINDYSANSNFTCNACHADTAADNSTISNRAMHVNGTKNIVFNAWVNSSAGYNPSTNECSNTYCHSAGTDYTATSHAPLAWNAGARSCNSCHDSPPSYSSGSPKENSHPAHTAYGCESCHYTTTNDGSTISNKATHVNKVYTLQNSGSYSFDVATQGDPTTPTVCSNISCHGGTGTGATWGQTLGCEGCHLVDGPDNEVLTGTFWSDGTASVLNSNEWTASGHGKTSGTYRVSGNNAANLSCTNCHDSNTAHGDSSNPFRLLYNASDNATWGLNWNCQVCHSYDQALATALVNSTHFGDKHSSSNSGGQFCWDCHDPHGDSDNTSGNIYMLHAEVANTSDSTTGAPTNTVPVAFLDNSTGTDYAKSTAPYDGVCNVCHTQTKHYTESSGDGHNSGSRCTGCHAHSHESDINLAFGGAGDCDGCHGYPPTAGDGKSNINSGGKGAHLKHVNTAVLDAKNDEYGNTGTGYAECAKCHYGAAHVNNVVEVSIDPAYGFDGVNDPQYLGVVGDTSVAKNCFNVLCHFTKTPRWSAPGDE